MICWKDLEIFSKLLTFSDIDCLDLFSELKILKEIMHFEDDTPVNIDNLIEYLILFQMHIFLIK